MVDEDLGIKIGSPLEVLWTNVKKAAESVITNCENELIIQREILKIAEQKIEETKLK